MKLPCNDHHVPYDEREVIKGPALVHDVEQEHPQSRTVHCSSAIRFGTLERAIVSLKLNRFTARPCGNHRALLTAALLAVGGVLMSGCSLSSDDQIAPKALKLVITGPSSAAPGVSTTGFTATLTQGDNEALEGAFVQLTAEQGSIDAPPDRPGTDGAETDGTGRVSFAFKPAATVIEAVTVKLVGHAEVGGRTADATYSVAVAPETFQFVSPAKGASAVVGVSHAIPLKLQWTRKAGSGVEGIDGNVRLTTDAGTFVVNGSALPPSEAIVLPTNGGAAGNFATPVAIAGSKRGLVTVTAADAELDSRHAQIIIQFVDQPTSLTLDADALTVQASPDASRFSNLTARVVNAQNEPVPGIEIRFQLTDRISDSVNERVLPSGGVTNENGSADSKYEAGPTNGTAVVRACIVGNTLCDSREIKVSGGIDSPGDSAKTPAALVLDATPLTVLAAPSESRFSTVTARVTNAAGQPVSAAQVEFSVKTPAGSNVNERVLPTTATTGDAGTATSKYEAGPTAGNAVVQGCVKGTTICGVRSVSVQLAPP